MATRKGLRVTALRSLIDSLLPWCYCQVQTDKKMRIRKLLPFIFSHPKLRSQI